MQLRSLRLRILRVLILNGLTMTKFSEKSTGLPTGSGQVPTRHYSRRRHPDALGKNSGRMDEGWPGLLGMGTGGGAGCEVGCGARGGAGCEVGLGFGWEGGCEAVGEGAGRAA